MKTLKFFAFAAAAVAMLSSCAKESVVSNKEDNGKTFTVTAEYTEPVADTKTAFVDGENPYVKWQSSDQIIVYESIDGEYKCYHSQKGNIILSDDDKKATFSINLHTPSGGAPTGTEYCYTAFYPADCVKEGTGFYYIEIPSIQDLNDNNFATDSDILIGKPIRMNSRISETNNIEVQFKRPGTVVALTLKGIMANETISSVKITAPAEEKIVGRCKVNRTNGEVSDKAYYGGTNVITLNCSDVVATGNDKFYFRCLDGTWKSDEAVSINVETDKAYYSKTVNLPKDYVFADGGLTKFGFQGMTREAKSTGTPYTLVTSDSDLCDGASYIFVGIKNEAFYAMAEQNTNNRKSATVSAPVDNVITLPSTTGAYTFQLEKVTDGWAIKDITTGSSVSGQYLYAAAPGNNYMKSQENVDVNATWTITISENIASIVASGSLNRKNMRFNENGGNAPLFSCYGNASDQSPIYLYVDKSTCKEKLGTPVLGTPTVNHFSKSITITWTDVANATVYEVSCGAEKQNINPGVQTCTFSDLSAGKYTITVKAVDGTGTYTPATATTDEITLGDPDITLSTTEVVNVAAEGGDFDDITYELKYAEDKDLSWTCDETVVTEVVVDGGEILYTVSENTAAEGRDGWIKVTLNGATQTITISQLGKGAAPDPVLTKLKDIADVPAAGVTSKTESGVYSLENAVFVDLNITFDGEVVTAASSTALGSITYTVDANTGAARTGTITISIEGAEPIEIDVFQEAGAKDPEVIYSTGFESDFTTGTNYQGTVTSGPSGQQWTIHYGNFSTSEKINGNNSAAIRLYTSENYGYLQTTFNLSNVTTVKYKAKAATTNKAKILLNTYYSLDGGSSWIPVDTDKEIKSTATDYEFEVNGNGHSNVRIKFAVSNNSTKPTSKNAQLTIDDIEIWGIK